MLNILFSFEIYILYEIKYRIYKKKIYSLIQTKKHDAKLFI